MSTNATSIGRSYSRARWIGHAANGYRCGETHHRATLTDIEVERIRQMREVDRLSVSCIAELCGVRPSTVRAIVYCYRRTATPVRWVWIGPSDEQGARPPQRTLPG